LTDGLVITRFGQVVRVAEFGLVLRLPLVDRSHSLPRAAMHLPITVSARTCDGVLVHLLATAVVRIVDPAAAAVVADSGSSTALAVHDALARRIARAEVADLLALRTELEPMLAAYLGNATAEWGVVVREIVVDGIEIELTAGLLGLAERSKP
jgi:hypothetical protein